MTVPEERNPLQARYAPADEGWLTDLDSNQRIGL
jgi:hypothetical protein